VSVTYAPLKEYGCEPRGAGDGRGEEGSDDGGDGPSPGVGVGDGVSGVPGNVGDGIVDSDRGGDGSGRSGDGNIGDAHVDSGVGVSGIGVYEEDDDDDDQLQTGDDEVFEPDDKDIGGADKVGNLATNPTTTLSGPATPTVSTPDDAAEAEELVQAAIKTQARVRGHLNDEKNDGSDKK